MKLPSQKHKRKSCYPLFSDIVEQMSRNLFVFQNKNDIESVTAELLNRLIVTRFRRTAMTTTFQLSTF